VSKEKRHLTSHLNITSINDYVYCGNSFTIEKAPYTTTFTKQANKGLKGPLLSRPTKIYIFTFNPGINLQLY
jgi:hypothetical protein